MAIEPHTFVVERRHGRESPALIVGPLPERLRAKGANLLVWACRIDKLPSFDVLRHMSIGELYDQYKRLKAKGRLPPSNLADPPRKTAGQKGTEHGPATWWKPTPLPRGDDWKP